MDIITAIILGIVEGATEFIPVSSTGHLIIVRQILGTDAGGLSFDAVLQLSTALALIVYFWKDLARLFVTFTNVLFKKNLSEKDKVLLFSIVLGTIPAIIFGLLLEEKMDTVFRSVRLVAVTLLLGSLLLYVAERFNKNLVPKQLTLGRGIVIGFFQCLALVPGISRSGSTISGGMIVGLSKEEAVRYSFLLSIPILLGSGLKKLFELKGEIFNGDLGSSLLVGSVVAFVVGLFSINFLIKYLKRNDFKVFIWYRVVVALILLFVSF